MAADGSCSKPLGSQMSVTMGGAVSHSFHFSFDCHVVMLSLWKRFHKPTRPLQTCEEGVIIFPTFRHRAVSTC